MPQYTPVFELTSLNGSNGFKIDGVSTSDQFGFSVSGAGDVNGDGYADIIIGARAADPNGVVTGASYVVFGHAKAFADPFSLTTLNGHNGFVLAGGTAGENSGYSVSAAGDVNGDGFDDVIVGAAGAVNGSAEASGGTYVVFGQGTPFDPQTLLGGLDGHNGFKITGEAGGDTAGFSVSSGDINGDGFDDLIIGAPYEDAGGDYSGSVYVVFGSDADFDATVDLGALDGTNGFKFAGWDEYDSIGWTVSAADVNGDGFDDLMFSGPQSDDEYSQGVAVIVKGKASGWAATVDIYSVQTLFFGGGEQISRAGDINGDGFEDIIVGTPTRDRFGDAYVAFGGAVVTFGFTIGKPYAHLSISAAGDVNGDGFDDLIIGQSGASLHGTGAGAAFVIFGKASGWDGTVNLTSLDGNNGFQINGEASADGVGFSVSGAGDINCDGFDDLIVGAAGADPNGASSGAAYVIYGSMPHEAVVRSGTAIANTIHGGNFDDTLVGMGGDDTLLAHGGDDVVIGGAGNDVVDAGNGNDNVFGGSGNDQLGGSKGADSLDGGSGNDVLTGGTEADTLRGGVGRDTLYGGDGNDMLTGGAGKDMLYGEAGANRFIFLDASDSTSTDYDTIVSANFKFDLIDLGVHIGKFDQTIASGNLSSGHFDADLAAAADAAHLLARHAVLFTPTGGALAGKTFLIADANHVAGYQAGEDYVIQLLTPVNLALLDVNDLI